MAVITGEPLPMQQDFTSLRKAGANLVQLSADGVKAEVAPYPFDSVAAARLDSAVHMAERAGLYVVIAARTGPGLADIGVEASHPGLQSRLWIDPIARRAFGEMWRRIARQFAPDSMVIGYNLIVEPLPEAAVPGLGWWSAAIADTALQHRGINWPVIADSIIAYIRQVDGITPVIVGASGFAAPPYFRNMQPVDDPYAVYDMHQYEPQSYTMQGNGPNYPLGLAWKTGRFNYWRDRTEHTLNRAWLRSILAPVRQFQERAHMHPVFVGEFGVNRQAPGAAAFLRAETAFFDSFGWDGAMWRWGCCASMRVDAQDSLSPDSAVRAIYKAYRGYWAGPAQRNH